MMNKFEIVASGYEPHQVDEAVESFSKLLIAKDDEIKSLNERISQMQPVIDDLEANKKHIEESFADATRTAEELKKKAQLQFEEEIESLRRFNEKWSHFAVKAIKELAPEQLQRIDNVGRKFQDILDAFSRKLGLREYYAAQPVMKINAFKPIEKLEKQLGAFKIPAKEYAFSETEEIRSAEKNYDNTEAEYAEPEIGSKTEYAEPETAQNAETEYAGYIPNSSEIIEAEGDAKPDAAFNIKAQIEAYKNVQEEGGEIKRADIINVKESLEELCRELGLMED